MNGKVINLDYLRDKKWRSFYLCGYIALSLQQQHSSHSNHEWAHASFRYCPNPQLTAFDEVLLKPAVGSIFRTLLGVRWKGDVKRQNMTGCVTSSRCVGTRIVLIPHSWSNFPVDSLQTQKLLQIYVGVFCMVEQGTLKEAGKLLQFPNMVKSKWPHYSFWITLGLPEVARKI